ncbi:hypothetical protein LCGC14_0667240 [marine sediment metagenome]|uniref:Uncharacterized protein n=1 Tax=marine sediment metagenome TaxID=412755 RepID=A0A0F9RC45_9ZZZZ
MKVKMSKEYYEALECLDGYVRTYFLLNQRDAILEDLIKEKFKELDSLFITSDIMMEVE